MKCLHCKGALTAQKTNYTTTRKGYHLIVDDVPAWVCDQCGEPLFEEKAVDMIQQMLEQLEQRIGLLRQIPLVV